MKPDLHAVVLHLFVQPPVILAACYVARRAARALGQPGVIGEMVAGIVLGPSLLGAWFPAVQAALFPADARAALFVLSQVGLVFYMFTVGLEFSPGRLAGLAPRAAAVSVAGVAVPLALGVALMPALTGARLLREGVDWTVSALFIGAALSVTAFPVLARILQEERLTHSHVGTLALAAAAVDDAMAWVLLALLMALLKGSAGAVILTLAGGALFVALALGVVRPMVARLFARGSDELSPETFTAAVILLLTSALCTEWLGLHLVFGAFIAGVALQPLGNAPALRTRTGDFVGVVLLPLFFTYSGLNTQIGLLATPAHWGIVLLVLAVATLGKLGGCAVAARLCGAGWSTSLGIGALMNARGLIELIMLNIGLEHGILTPDLFTAMVLMAVATTILAKPLLHLTQRRERSPVPYRAFAPPA